MMPTPKPHQPWNIEAAEGDQMILTHAGNGCRILLERRQEEKGVFILAAGASGKHPLSTAVFRDVLVSMFPDLHWGKLPRGSRLGLRAIAKVPEGS